MLPSLIHFAFVVRREKILCKRNSKPLCMFFFIAWMLSISSFCHANVESRIISKAPMVIFYKISTTNSEAKSEIHCGRQDCEFKNPIFQGLKNIGLQIFIDAQYQQAIDCHGKEEECVAKIGGIDKTPERRIELVKNLAADYDTIPAPLRPNEIISAFRKILGVEIGPYISANADCSTLEIPVLSGKQAELFANNPDNLTIVLSLRIFDDVKPKIAVLSMQEYRKNHAVKNLAPKLVAIPLDLSEPEIRNRIAAFTKSYDVLTSCEISQ